MKLALIRSTSVVIRDNATVPQGNVFVCDRWTARAKAAGRGRCCTVQGPAMARVAEEHGETVAAWKRV